MVCHGQCASSPAFQQPANFNVALVKKTEMVRHGQAMRKQRSFSAAGQFQCCASQEDRDGESSTLKFWIAGSDARSVGTASPGSAPGYGKVLKGL